MKKRILVFLLLLTVSAWGQIAKSTISGKIVDKKSGHPLPYVNVFIANSTMGSATDSTGYYEIINIGPGSYTLIFANIGYKMIKLPLDIYKTKDLVFNIELEQEVLSGEEIAVEASAIKGWDDDFKRFERYFLGSRKNSRDCEIVNPYVLNFTKDRQIFQAQTDSILIIDNNAIGYRIYLILEEFQWMEQNINYKIYPKFVEMTPQDSLQKVNWILNRRETYRGSLKHFLACFVQDSVKENNYELFRGFGRKVGNQRFIKTVGIKSYVQPDTSNLSKVEKDLNLKRLKFKDYLKVVYKGSIIQKKSSEGQFFSTSFLKLNYKEVLVDPLGNLFPYDALTISGDWGTHRIADMLPLDYQND